MSAAPPSAAALQAEYARDLTSGRGFALADAVSLAVLFLLFAALVLPYDRLPMLMVDESRNALDAQSIALHGHWLVPYYDGHPDHWNTKPPLLIWIIAGLMRLGLPPLLALRLPSLLAAATTVTMAWAFCRYVLHDRVAAFLGGLLLLTCSLYMGPHVARSGDFDSLLCAFTLGQALAMWIAIERDGAVSIPAFAVWAACLVGAFMTKSIAGGLILPGLLSFAILRGRLPMLLRNWRVWALTFAAVGLCVAYYLTRPLYDPGYLHAAWQNDLGGRFAEIHEKNTGGPLYYVLDLVRRFEPGLLLLPLATFSLFARNPRRRSIVLLCLIASAEFLVVISAAKTKLYWYAAPMIPLLSIAGGIGIVDALGWLARRKQSWLAQPRLAGAGLAALLACAAVVCVVRNQVWSVAGLHAANNDQFWYAHFLNDLRRDRAAPRLTVVDGGMPNHGGFRNYNPMLDFYARFEDVHGMPVTVIKPGASLPAGTAVATCDRNSLGWLQAHATLDIQRRNSTCVFGHVVASDATSRNG